MALGLFNRDKPASGDGQTEAEKKLAAHVRTKVEEVRSSANRVAHEGIWMTNIAYLLGYDGVQFSMSTRTFQPVNRGGSSGTKKLHVNKILPTVQNRLARLCKNPPKYDVRPESNDSEDREAARLAIQVLTYLWDELSYDEKRISLYMWLQECGHAYIKVGWDPSAGKFMQDPETQEPGFEGQVYGDVVSPFEVFPDPMAKSFDEVKRSWLIQCKVRKLNYFKTHYKRGTLVKAEEAWLLSAQYEQRINSLNSRGPTSGIQEAMKDSAIEMVKYEAPSLQYPNGRMIVAANGVLLENKELPVGEIPFAKFDDIQIGGKYYSESIITHLRPIQDQYNETVRRRAAWTRKLLAGKYKAARGSGIAAEALDDESGELLYYDATPNSPNGPEALQIPMIPQWAYNEEDKLIQMFNDISGISEVSRGTMPSASIPAIGMQLLTEQDDTRIGITTEQHEHAWARVGSLSLKYAERHWKMPRKLKVAGKALEYAVQDVVGDQINGATDVIVIRGSTLPGSKTLNRQNVLNAWQQGLMGNVQDPKVIEQVLGMIEFGDTQGLWEDFGLDMAQITRGIKVLEQGTPLEVDILDNHALWILELNRYRKTEKYEQMDHQLQDLFQATIQSHTQAIVQMNTPPPNPPTPPDMGMGQDPSAAPPPGQAPEPQPGAAA